MKVVATGIYDGWFRRLKRRDPWAAARIQVRVDRLTQGNPGDAASSGRGLSELRIHHGPGYRVYYWQKGDVLVILLCGGDKATQTVDIAKAHELAEEWQKRGEH